MSFILYPGIDVRGGRVVRLRQGDFAHETAYDDEPLALALRYAAAGATWLHLVDLDAARDGGYGLACLLRSIKSATPLNVQTGGGVRSEADVESILAAGADRVVVGSLAIREPERVSRWLATFGAHRITLALDARRDSRGIWRLPSDGWCTPSPQTLEVLACRFMDAGLEQLLCTDIDRDGMLAGPNLQLYDMLARRLPGVSVQASGGMRSAGDIRAVRAAGCAGAVVGKALLDQKLTVTEALAC